MVTQMSCMWKWAGILTSYCILLYQVYYLLKKTGGFAKPVAGIDLFRAHFGILTISKVII